MMRSAPHAWLALALAVAPAVAPAVAVPSARAEESAAASKQGREPTSAGATRAGTGGERIELERLRRHAREAKDGQPVSNAFNPKRWYVPPPPRPPPPPPAPPPPTAPPVPFTYLGRYQDAQKLVVMLARGNKLYTVSQGEVIDGTYRVDRISDSAVDLTYLPLNTSQAVSTTPAPESVPRSPGIGQFTRRP